MANDTNDIETAFHQIVDDQKLDIAQLDYLMNGYANGFWSSRRVQRELDIDRVVFWYIKAYYGVSIGASPSPHYWSKDEVQAELERENAVANFIFSDGDIRPKVESVDATFQRLIHLIKQPARRTILVPVNHEVIMKLHQLNKLDALHINAWETHLSRISLLVASNSIGFAETLRMMRSLPKSIFICNEMYSEYRDVSKQLDKNEFKNILKALNFAINNDLATDLQDDAQLNLDTIYLHAMCVDKMIDSRNFIISVDTLLALLGRVGHQ